MANEQDSHDTAPLNKTVILHQPKWAPTMLNLTGKPKHSFWRYSLENTISLLINPGLFYLLWSDVCFNNWYLYQNILEFHSTYKPSFYSSNLLATSYPKEKVPWTTAAWKVAIFPPKKLHTMFLTESCMYCKPRAIKKYIITKTILQQPKEPKQWYLYYWIYSAKLS